MTNVLALQPGQRQSLSSFEEHDHLVQEYESVLTELHRMQIAQLSAVLDGEDFPFEEWIARAVVRMMQAKYALRAYRQEHGGVDISGQV
jgi:hypothetical protein